MENIESEKTINKQQIAKLEGFSYAMYIVGENIVFIAQIMFLAFFWAEFLGISPVAIGLIFIVARTWDAINDPILGGIIQSTNPKRNKYKIWLILGAVLLPIISITLYIPAVAGWEPAAIIAYAAITYIAFGMIYTLTDVPIYSLAMTMTNDQKTRGKLLAFGRMGAGVGGIIASMVFTYLFFAIGPFLAALVIAILTFFTMILVLFCKERYYIQEVEKFSVKTMLVNLIKNKHQLKLHCISIIVMTLLFSYSAIMLFVIQYAINPDNFALWAMIFLTYGSLVSIITPLIMIYLKDKFGKRNSLFYVTLIVIVCLLITSVILVMSDWSIWAFMLVLPFYGALGQIWFLFYALFNMDTIEYGEYTTNNRQEAISFATQTFVTKLGIALGGIISSLILIISHYQNPSDFATLTINAGGVIESVPTWVSDVFPVLSSYYDPIIKTLLSKLLAFLDTNPGISFLSDPITFFHNGYLVEISYLFGEGGTSSFTINVNPNYGKVGYNMFWLSIICLLIGAFTLLIGLKWVINLKHEDVEMMIIQNKINRAKLQNKENDNNSQNENKEVNDIKTDDDVPVTIKDVF